MKVKLKAGIRGNKIVFYINERGFIGFKADDKKPSLYYMDKTVPNRIIEVPRFLYESLIRKDRLGYVYPTILERTLLKTVIIDELERIKGKNEFITNNRDSSNGGES